MTDNGMDKASEKAQRWFADVQGALDRTSDALRTAWDATKDSRMSALESAKQAAQELGEVIDQGISAAKERWAASETAGAESAPSADVPVEEEAAPKEPIAIESEPTPDSSDVTVTPVESDTTDQA